MSAAPAARAATAAATATATATASSNLSRVGASVSALLDSRTARFPSKDLVRWEAASGVDAARWSTAQLRKHARAVAGGLAQLGVRGPGAAALAVLPNNPERLTLQLAAAMSGSLLAVADARAFPGASAADGSKALAAALKASAPRVLVVPPGPVVAALRALEPEELAADGGETFGRPLRCKTAPALRFVLHTARHAETRLVRFRDVLTYNAVPDPVDALVAPAPDAPALQLLDAATGAPGPKPVTVGELLAQAQAVCDKLSLGPNDRVLLSSAKGDARATLVAALACLNASAQLIIPSGNPATLKDTIAAERITAAVGDSAAPAELASRFAQA